MQQQRDDRGDAGERSETHQESDEPLASDETHADPSPLPTSLIPRWLAWVVLLALLGSAGVSVCSLLSKAPPG